MKPAQFEMSPDTRFIKQRLAKLGKGDFVSYDELSAIISKKVVGSSASLASAKRSLLHDGYVFSAVSGEGVRRLDDTEIVENGTRDTELIHRRAKRAAKNLSVVDIGFLNQESITKQATAMSSLLGVQTISSEKALTTIFKAVGNTAAELPLTGILKALGVKN